MNKVQAMRLSLRRFSLMLLILGLQISAGGEQAKEGFEVEGIVTQSLLDGDNYSKHSEWRFVAKVQGARWLQTTYLPDGQKMVHGSDGRDVYHIFVPADTAQAKSLGVVVPGNYPSQAPGYHLTLPWLAYCSESWLVSQTTSNDDTSIAIPAPWVPAALEPEAHAYRGTIRWLASNCRLPSYIAYQADAGQIARMRSGDLSILGTLNKSQQDALMMSLKRLEQVTVPTAIYEVLRVTNFGGMILPAEFELRAWRSDLIQSTNDPGPFTFRLHGRALQIKPLVMLDPMPQNSLGSSMLRVADYRFFNATAHLGWLSYEISKSEWRTNTDDPWLQAKYRQAINEAMSHAGGKSSQPWLVASAMMLLLLLPLGLPLVRASLIRCLRVLHTGRRLPNETS